MEAITISEIAKLFGVSVRTAHRIVGKPGFPRARRPGSHRRWVRREVLAWFDTTAEQPTALEAAVPARLLVSRARGPRLRAA